MKLISKKTKEWISLYGIGAAMIIAFVIINILN
jgi:hypothetical protein